MPRSWHFALLILGYPYTLLNAQKECEPGRFGSDCQYSCHCNGSCGVDGSCVDGCSLGWFGPQCRYENLRYNTVTDPVEDVYALVDDDRSCTNHTSDLGPGINVIFPTPTLFVWMRIALKSPDQEYFTQETGVKIASTESLKKLQIQFRSKQQRESERLPCTNKSMVRQHNAVDIVCQKVQDCADIYLTWDDMRLLCRIYVFKECYPGYYGPDCVNRCSDVCLESMCNSTDGHCVNCPSGHSGTRCEKECEPTYYGINCQLRCSRNCLNHFCSRSSGNCVACALGRSGNMCDQETLTDLFNGSNSNDSVQNQTHQKNQTDGSTAALIAAPIVACVVGVVLVAVLYRRRDKICSYCLGPRYPKYRVFTTSDTDFSPDENDDTVIISS